VVRVWWNWCLVRQRPVCGSLDDLTSIDLLLTIFGVTRDHARPRARCFRLQISRFSSAVNASRDVARVVPDVSVLCPCTDANQGNTPSARSSDGNFVALVAARQSTRPRRLDERVRTVTKLRAASVARRSARPDSLSVSSRPHRVRTGLRMLRILCGSRAA
jgi:hypothetical protein